MQLVLATLTQLDAATALTWVARLCMVSVLIQTLELWQLRRVAADDGIWRWSIVRRDFEVFGSTSLRLVDRVLSYDGLRALLVLRGLCALTLLWLAMPVLAWLLLLSTVLIALRWGGSFNGGSDFMTLVVLSALCVVMTFPSARTISGALWYIGLITCNSYFLAGLAKLRTHNWRTGRALSGFLRHTIYGPAPLRRVWERPRVACALCWCVISLELVFPAALLHPALCMSLTGTALLFHLGNAYVFGLNRFVLAWVATYPALYWCSQHMF